MEPVALVVSALVAGATAGISGVVTSLVVDAYEELKSLVVGCFRRGGVAEDIGRDLIARAGDSTEGREKLALRLASVDLDEPTVRAAQKLLDLLEAQHAKFNVDASQAKGVIVGDHATQHNTFN